MFVYSATWFTVKPDFYSLFPIPKTSEIGHEHSSEKSISLKLRIVHIAPDTNEKYH